MQSDLTLFIEVRISGLFKQVDLGTSAVYSACNYMP